MSARPRPATEDKLEALHYQLIEAVADLATSEGWRRMLAVAARFHDYSGGGVGVSELRECRVHPCAKSSRVKVATGDRLLAPSARVAALLGRTSRVSRSEDRDCADRRRDSSVGPMLAGALGDC